MCCAQILSTVPRLFSFVFSWLFVCGARLFVCGRREKLRLIDCEKRNFFFFFESIRCVLLSLSFVVASLIYIVPFTSLLCSFALLFISLFIVVVYSSSNWIYLFVEFFFLSCRKCVEKKKKRFSFLL